MRKLLATLVAATALVGTSLVAADVAGAGDGDPESYNDVFDSHPLTVNGDYEPLLLACGEDALILWYAAGSATDYLWTIERSDEDELHYSSEPTSINGTYDPIVGDFDGDACDDIVWYTPGPAADYVWWGGAEGFSSQPVTINGTYQPVAGDFSEQGHGIFWYSPGSGAEYLWSTGGDRSFESTLAPPVSGTYRIASNHGAVFFHRPGSGLDYLWLGVDAEAGTVEETKAFQINGTYEPSAGIEGFLLYGPGSAPDYLFWHLDKEGKPVTLPATINGVYETGERSPYLSFVHIWHAAGPASDHLWVPAQMRPADAAATANSVGRDSRW